MKKLMLVIAACLVVSACSNGGGKTETEDQRIKVDTVYLYAANQQQTEEQAIEKKAKELISKKIPQGFEWTSIAAGDGVPVYVKYKQKVNGYKVSAICMVDPLLRFLFSRYYQGDGNRSSPL